MPYSSSLDSVLIPAQHGQSAFGRSPDTASAHSDGRSPEGQPRPTHQTATGRTTDGLSGRPPGSGDDSRGVGLSDLRKWLHSQHIGVRIARKGIDSSERLDRRRWIIERTISWLTGYRRLSPRYERHPRNYLAFLGLAAAICCNKRFLKLTM